MAVRVGGSAVMVAEGTLAVPAIQAPILNGLADVGGPQIGRAIQIGDRPGDLEHPVVRPRGEPQPVDCVAEQRLDQAARAAMAPEVARGHVGVGMQAGTAAEALSRWTSRARSTRALMAALGSSLGAPTSSR
jgi:hypothetical protein